MLQVVESFKMLEIQAFEDLPQYNAVFVNGVHESVKEALRAMETYETEGIAVPLILILAAYGPKWIPESLGYSLLSYGEYVSDTDGEHAQERIDSSELYEFVLENLSEEEYHFKDDIKEILDYFKYCWLEHNGGFVDLRRPHSVRVFNSPQVNMLNMLKRDWEIEDLHHYTSHYMTEDDSAVVQDLVSEFAFLLDEEEIFDRFQKVLEEVMA